MREEAARCVALLESIVEKAIRRRFVADDMQLTFDELLLWKLARHRQLLSSEHIASCSQARNFLLVRRRLFDRLAAHAATQLLRQVSSSLATGQRQWRSPFE